MRRSEKQPARHPACLWCGRQMPDALRSHARYCKAACRVMAYKSRRRAATAEESVNAGTLARHPAPAEPTA